jgi:NTE family protein
MITFARACRSKAAVFFGAAMLAGCATATINTPLPPEKLGSGDGPISQSGYRLTALDGNDTSPELLVLVSFSGGGKRSAAFGYGVLKGLRDFPIVVDGKEHRLLDEIDMTTSVSGGSFPAAYYGLYRDKIFTDFDKDFLNQDIESYIWGTYLLPWNLAWLFSPGYGTNDRMAEVYDKLMFHGATYADLARGGRPLVSIDATDVDNEQVFTFTQDQFDLICSDLSQYSLARAVAASNGFPVLFTPITLKSYSECHNRVPAWVQSERDEDELSRTHQLAQTARRYLDPARTRYVHLLDGGVADNLAMRGMINAILVLTHENMQTKIDMSRIRRILLISADGEAENQAAGALKPSLSGLGQVFNAVSGTQIDSYNFETLILAKEQIGELRDLIKKQRCSGAPPTDGHPCGDVEAYFAHLSLAGIADPAERARLGKIPTGLTIDSADVASLVAAGEQQVRESSALRDFRDGLANAIP